MHVHALVVSVGQPENPVDRCYAPSTDPNFVQYTGYNMRTIKFIVLFVISTLYHVDCCIASEGQFLRYEIMTDKDSYRIGEHIIVTLSLTNISTKRVLVSDLIVPGASVARTRAANHDSKKNEVWSFAVFTRGEQIDYQGRFKSFPPQKTQLDPGNKIEARFQLDSCYDLSKSGTYILTATHFNHDNLDNKEDQMNVIRADHRKIIIKE